jgi:phosphopantetheinyl transferase (holo-ACP synthase)
MPLTCGIDIENEDRVERLLLSGLLPEDIFLASEWSSMHLNRSFSSVYFTTKEAVLKALGLGWSLGQLSGQEIELRVESDCVVGLRLNGELKELFRSMGYKSMTLSHDRVGKDLVTEVTMSDRYYEYPARCKVIVSIRDVEDILEQGDSVDGRIHSMDPRRTLTKSEHAEIQFRRKATYIAGRVAAKQCVHNLLMAMGSGASCKPEEIEILGDAAGRPFIHNAFALGLEIIPVLSISHSRDYAVALAVVYHDRRIQKT